jgi:hypothetical protein
VPRAVFTQFRQFLKSRLLRKRTGVRRREVYGTNIASIDLQADAYEAAMSHPVRANPVTGKRRKRKRSAIFSEHPSRGSAVGSG